MGKIKCNKLLGLLFVMLFMVFICIATSCNGETPQIYTVTVLQTSGGNITTDKNEVAEGGNVTVTVEAYSKYGLSSLQVNGQNVEVNNNVHIVRDVKTDLIISATFIKQESVITFVIGEGAKWIGEEPSNFTITKGLTYGNLPDSTDIYKPGHIFEGWYTAEEGGTLITSQTTVDELCENLYAHWKTTVTTHTGSGNIEIKDGNNSTLTYITKTPTIATFDDVNVVNGSISANLKYDKSVPTRTGLIFRSDFSNQDPLNDNLKEFGEWATGKGASYYMFYIEMQSGTLLLYKTEGNPGYYIEVTTLENAGEAYRTKFNSGATEFNLKATYLLNEKGSLIIKLYIDDELQLWFEDVVPLLGTGVGICSNKENTEFNDFKCSTEITEDMKSPIISTQIAFTVSKGNNGEYNTYKGWPNSRSIAYLKDAQTDKNVGATGVFKANITPNRTKNAIVLFASSNAVVNTATQLTGIHFIIQPTASGYNMYICCVRNEHWVISELGTDAVELALPNATTFGVEIDYEVKENKDIAFTFKATAGGNTYTRSALWPTVWDTDTFWSRDNYYTDIAIWQEAGGSSVIFGDVEFVGQSGESGIDPATQPLKDKKILFLGDSITAGTGASTYSKCYVADFEKISGMDVKNYGVGGTTITRMDNPVQEIRIGYNFIDRVDCMDSDADYVVVFGGVNDYFRSDREFGTISDTVDTTFCGALNVLYSKLQNKYSNAKIIVVTPTHCSNENNTTNIIGLTCKTLSEHVDAIKEVSEAHSIPVIDLWDNSEFCGDVNTFIQTCLADGLHPNDLGSKKIAEEIYNFLLEL